MENPKTTFIERIEAIADILHITIKRFGPFVKTKSLVFDTALQLLDALKYVSSRYEIADIQRTFQHLLRDPSLGDDSISTLAYSLVGILRDATNDYLSGTDLDTLLTEFLIAGGRPMVAIKYMKDAYPDISLKSAKTKVDELRYKNRQAIENTEKDPDEVDRIGAIIVGVINDKAFNNKVSRGIKS